MKYKPLPPEELNEAEAKRVYRNFSRRLNRLTIKARGGDNEAAMQIIVRMTEMCEALKALGYRTTDEDGERSRLVPVTQEWIDAELAKETEIDKAIKRGRKSGDYSEVIMMMAEGKT